MSAYIVVEMEIHDREGFAPYPPQVAPLLARYGGRITHRLAHFEAWEGDWKPSRMVIIEFPALDDLRRFYASAEFQPLKALRQRTTTSRLVVAQDEARAGR